MVETQLCKLRGTLYNALGSGGDDVQMNFGTDIILLQVLV